MSKRKWCPLCGISNEIELHKSITSTSIRHIPTLLSACKSLLHDWGENKNLSAAAQQIANAVAKAEGRNT